MNDFLFGCVCIFGLIINAALLALLIRPMQLNPILEGEHQRVGIMVSPFVLGSNSEVADFLVPSAAEVDVLVHVFQSDDGHWRIRNMGSGSVEFKGRPLTRVMRLFDGNELRINALSLKFKDPNSTPNLPSFSGYRLKGSPMQGGSSLLYPGRSSDGTNVLIKVRDPSVDEVGREQLNARIDAEFEILSRVARPNRYGFFPDTYELLLDVDEFKAIVMENVPGLTLREAMDQRRFSVRDVMAFGSSAARALDHLNTYDVVHADLKPSNIVLRHGRASEPCLVDFGIAIQSGGRTTSGTRSYMSPEHGADSVNPLTSKSDVYVLGILLQQALPPIDPNADARARRIHDAITQVASEMLRPHPDDRPSAREVYTRLTGIDEV